MLKPRSLIIGLVASVWLCPRVLCYEQEYLPDTSQKAPIPVPMTVFKVPPLKAKPGDDAALGLLNAKPVDHGEMVVRFKTLATEGDQAAGMVFHYQDSSNYYVMVASAKDESCTLYRVLEGKRKKIDSKDVIVSPLTWHEFRVVFAQDKYTALVDGELVLGVKDSSFTTPGLIGLWTPAGAQIVFDNLRVSRP
jgi:hypothetical protein